MPANTIPIFPNALNVGLAAVPNTVVTGGPTSLLIPTGGTTLLFTAGVNGSRVDLIRINQVQTTNAAGILGIWLNRSSTNYLLDFYIFPVGTVSTTASAQPIDIPYNDLLLKNGDTLTTGLTVAQTATPTIFTVEAFGGDF